MNVQKCRNFVITDFVKSGIHCIGGSGNGSAEAAEAALKSTASTSLVASLSIFDADAVDGVRFGWQDAIAEFERRIFELEGVPLNAEALGFAGAAQAGFKVAPIADVSVLNAGFVFERDEASFRHQTRQQPLGL